MRREWHFVLLANITANYYFISVKKKNIKRDNEEIPGLSMCARHAACVPVGAF